jgi:hypothetical protein
MQQVLVFLVFIGAVIYLGRVIYNHFTEKASCASNCGKCNAIDLKKIEEQFKADSLKTR